MNGAPTLLPGPPPTDGALSWLARVSRSPLRECFVLRGGMLTATWVPGRRANDVDHVLIDDDWNVERVEAAARSLLGDDAASTTFTVIWAETEWPGLRLTLADNTQIDLAWGDPLIAPPVPLSLGGIDLLAVRPELMIGWKTHSLVERGPRGRWHARTLADLVLIPRHVPLDRALTRQAIEIAFTSRHMHPRDLDGFFDDPTWGGSRGSRGRWKSYRKASPWVDFTLEQALAEARAFLTPLLRGPG
jgi:hypothetical protein